MTSPPLLADTVRARPRFATRLLVAQALVLVAGALTTWLVASVVGPSIFSDHLQQAGDPHTGEETRHVEEAFASALVLSVSLALLASVLAALAVSWYFSRRVQRSIGDVAAAAADIAAGRYDARVPDPGLGGEFVSLALTYNRLAERLEATETWPDADAAATFPRAGLEPPLHPFPRLDGPPAAPRRGHVRRLPGRGGDRRDAATGGRR